MPLPRRRLLAWLAGLLVGTLPWRSAESGEVQPALANRGAPDPILLVDGWLLRQSDLEAFTDQQKPDRHDP